MINSQEPQIIPSLTQKRGFTVVELMVVLVVLTILAVAAVPASYEYLVSSRDRERASDVDTISRSLEQYYRTQSVATGATYPSAAVTPTAFASIVGDTDVIAAPDVTSNSVVVANATGVQAPTESQYSYQALRVDGSLCTASPCPRYRLYYRTEEANEVVVKNSMRQQ